MAKNMTKVAAIGSKVQVTQNRSAIGRNPEVRATLTALGLGRIGKSTSFTVNASVQGMLRKVSHLVTFAN